MADPNVQRRHGRRRQPGRYAPEGHHPQRPPARSRAMQPEQAGLAPSVERLTHHAPARPQPRRALVVSPWYRKKRFALPLAALVALVVVIGVGGTGNDSPAPVAGVPVTSAAAGSTTIVQPAAAPAAAPTQQATEKATEKATPTKVTKKADIGDTVRAGDWQFKVTDFDCGRSEVGDEGHVKKPRGQFCVLELSAKNNSDDEGIVAAGGQTLSDDDGRTYRSDRKAALADDADSSLFLEGVDPGTTAKGTVVFDVPEKVKITEVTLTGGGVFDGKATVRLR